MCTLETILEIAVKLQQEKHSLWLLQHSTKYRASILISVLSLN